MTLMNPPADAAMNIQVSGRHIDVGEALRSRITDELTSSIGKYFERGGSAEVAVSKDGHSFCVDIVAVLASGQQVVATAKGADAHGAFSMALGKIETRIRRYKRRLKNHHQDAGAAAKEAASYVVLRAPSDEDAVEDEWGADGSAGSGAPAAAIIAETQAAVKTMTVSMAVMDLDLSDAPVVLFRNAAHGGLSVVYRRRDGNIGWIDPERTRAARAADAANEGDTDRGASERGDGGGRKASVEARA